MMQRPWDCAQPDEWLPRNLRLCWGSSDGGDSTGASTGGGDWGSSGSFDASGFNADAFGGDPTAGWAIDAANGFGQFGTGPGEWYDAGPYNAAGLNSPGFQPTEAGYAALESGGAYNPGAGLPGVTTGGGDWGSAGAFSAAGTGGGPGGAMFGAGLGAGAGVYGGGGGGGGGGLLGDYGGGGVGGGGGGGGGGRGGSGAFGSFGTLGASNTGRGSETPSPAGFADTAGGGRSAGPASVARSDAPTRGEAEVSSVSDADQAAPDADTSAPEAAPSFGTPTTAAPPQEDVPPGTPTTAAPEPDTTTSATPSPGREPDTQTAPAFGPQSLSYDYEGSPYADMGPQQAGGGAPAIDWGSVFEGAAAPAVEPGVTDPTALGVSNFPGSSWADYSKAAEVAQNFIGSHPFFSASTWLSPTNQQTFNEIANIPSALNNFLNPTVPTMLQAPSTMDQQALGEQGRAGQMTDLASQLGIETVGAPQGIDPGTEQYGTESFAPGGIDPGTAQYATAPDPATQLGIESVAPVDWSSVFEAPAQAPDWGAVFEGAAPAAEPDWDSVFEGAAPDPIDWGSVFEGAPTSPDWTSVFEGAAPTYDTTMESGQPGEPTTTDTTATPGGDPALSGASVDAANAAANAAKDAGASQQAADAAAAAAADAAARGGDPGEQANAAAAAAVDKGATPEQANTIANGVYDAAVTAGQVSKGSVIPEQSTAPITLEAIASAVRGVEPDLPGAAPEPAPSGPDLPGAPEGPQTAPSGITSSIPGGRATDFNYGTPQAQPGQPGLADMRGQPGMPMPQARPAEAPQPGQPGGIGSDYVAGDDADHDSPEPADSSLPQGDPNAPRPPGDIPAQPGQLLGTNGTYQNQRADNPQTNRNYRDSGRTDYPQGRPGIDFRTARQAGIAPLFRTEDINTQDLDARLVERINRAMQDMPANIRDGLTASSAYRAAHRGEALEHMMDPRTSQESVYSRGHPSSGGGGFPSARPGNSNHGHGRAIDFLSSPALTWLRANAGRYGLETIAGDHPHIQLSGARGNVGARPSAQEQQAQRALDAQNRQAAVDRGLIASGRGQAPVQQARPAAPPGGWRGIGGDIGREARMAQPGVPPPAAVPPADIPPPAALPPQDAPPAPSVNWDALFEAANAPTAAPPAGNLPPAAPAPAPLTVGKVLAPLFGKLPGDQAKQVSEGLGKLSEKEQAALLTKGPAAIVAELARQGGRDPTTVQNWLNGSYAMFGYPGYPGGYAQFSKDVAAAAAAYTKSLPGRAKGGRVDDDEPVVVGEEGPEVFVPDRPGTVWPHVPQPGGPPGNQPGQSGKPGNIDRWPKGPAVGYPGQYGGVEREMRRQTRAAQEVVPSLMDMIDSGQLRLNAANWNQMINDPSLIALGRSRIEDRRGYPQDYPY